MHDLQSVTRLEIFVFELGGRDRFTVVFHNHAAGREMEGEQESFDGAGEFRMVRFAIGMNEAGGLQGLFRECCVPVLPDRFVSQAGNEPGHFVGGTFVRNFKLASGAA